tara:strand:+ start:68 stop:1153 length:1086 start_codon:yes stop_codon:yes gene_type:complete
MERTVSVPKRRGRKPKPTPTVNEADPNVIAPVTVKKRGRKPKIRPIVEDVIPKNMVNDGNENIILHIPIQERLLLKASGVVDDTVLTYEPLQKDPEPFNPNECIEKTIGILDNTRGSMNFTELPATPPIDSETRDRDARQVFTSVLATGSGSHTTSQHKQINTVCDGLQGFIDTNMIDEWPVRTDISCWWCCHSFESVPIGLPNKCVKSKFSVIGCFCSFNCAAAYNNSMNDNHEWERESLLKHLQRKMCNMPAARIIPAPDKEVLMAFGGTVSISDYRDNLKCCKKQYRLVMPPMLSIIPQIEEVHFTRKRLSGSVTKKKQSKYVPLNMKEVEKAIANVKKRKEPVNKSSLQYTMGLVHG